MNSISIQQNLKNLFLSSSHSPEDLQNANKITFPSGVPSSIIDSFTQYKQELQNAISSIDSTNVIEILESTINSLISIVNDQETRIARLESDYGTFSNELSSTQSQLQQAQDKLKAVQSSTSSSTAKTTTPITSKPISNSSVNTISTSTKTPVSTSNLSNSNTTSSLVSSPIPQPSKLSTSSGG